MINTRELDNLIKKVKEAADSDKIHRTALLMIHGMTNKRIFTDGIKANGKLIGVYSAEYQQTRKRKNYPISRKIIFQATGQMVNDYVFIVKGKEYGSGFNQKINFDKSNWLEKRFGIVWDLTPSEEKQIPKAYEAALKQLFK